MTVSYEIQPLDANCMEKNFKLNKIKQCPICKASILPQFLYGVYKNNLSTTLINCFFLCNNCENTFIGSYSEDIVERANSEPGKIISVEPNHFTKKNFDNLIEKLSSQYVKIYNQALAAESSELDEIAGLGYRKSLEFLVKDYCIHKYPENKEEIKKIPLSQCIKKYIDNVEIKTLAERSAWIGNDEAHYIRKQTNRDIRDMKKFINAIEHFISMILAVEDAASMESCN